MSISSVTASREVVAFSMVLTLLAVTADGQLAFTEVSESAGLSDPFFTSPTSHSLGVNWLDYDNDGWVDLFAVGGAPTRPSLLFRNRGDGTFESMPQLLPSLPDYEKTGSLFGDYDDDGDQDIYIYTDTVEINHISYCILIFKNNQKTIKSIFDKTLGSKRNGQTNNSCPCQKRSNINPNSCQTSQKTTNR